MKRLRRCRHCQHEMFVDDYYKSYFCDNCGCEYGVIAEWDDKYNIQYRCSTSNHTQFTGEV